MSISPAVAELLLRYEELRGTGRKVSAEELCRGRPELLEIVKQHLADLDVIDRFLQPGPDEGEHPTVVPLSSEHGSDETSGDTIVTGATYRVEKLHARGGLGVIHVATDDALGRSVALKRMQGPAAGNGRNSSRFRWEAEVTSRLEHPGIVPVYGIGTDQRGEPCYAMRFVEGETFDHAIRRFHDEKSKLPSGERAIRFRKLLQQFVAVCNTVAFAHSRGIIHRDIKPANILLGSFGETLVVDWGLAKECTRPASEADIASPGVTHSDSTWQATKTGNLLGTPTFMSPEQAAGRVSNLGPASDIWSLGATLYVLLVNQTPYAGRHVGEILEQVRTGVVVHPRKIMPSLPRSLEAVCLKAMAIRPEDRYPTALHLAEDIEHWLADEPVSVYHEALHVRVGRWTRRHKALASVCTVALFGTVVFSAYFAYEQGRRTDLRRQWAFDQIDKLVVAPASDVPGIVGQIPVDDPAVADRLRSLIRHQGSSGKDDRRARRARLALLRTDASLVDSLFENMVGAEAPETDLILQQLHASNVPTDFLIERLQAELRRSESPRMTLDEREMLAQRQATAAALLIRLGAPEDVWPVLKHSPDPTRRSFLIHRIIDEDVPPEVIFQRLTRETDVSVRRALLLCLGGYGPDRLPEQAVQAWTDVVAELYRKDGDAGIHSAAEWLLRRWGKQDQLRAFDEELRGGTQAESKWQLTRTGHTMAILRGRTFSMGSPDSERDREDNEPQHERTIPHSFAIATKEVTIAEFRRVFPHHVQSSRYSPSDDCPALGATWYEAMMYCRWLSEQEALETSYPSRDVIEQRLAARQAISLEKNPLHCPGYRLPTEAEWEFACRADTATSRCCGSADVLLDHYGWYGRNATERARPVGLLKPNDFGLFDVHGNAYEWCHTQGGNHLKGHSLGDIFIAIENSRVIRGGAFFEPAKHLRAAQRDVLLPATSLQSVGFRVARTLHK